MQTQWQVCQSLPGYGVTPHRVGTKVYEVAVDQEGSPCVRENQSPELQLSFETTQRAACAGSLQNSVLCSIRSALWMSVRRIFQIKAVYLWFVSSAEVGTWCFSDTVCVSVSETVSAAACAEPSVCCFSSSLPVPGLICARGPWPTLTFCSLGAHMRVL